MSVWVSAILLAAGKSRRMGKLKLLLPFRGSTILEHAVDNLLNSKVAEVILVVGYQAQELVSKIAQKPVKIVVNPQYQQGMSTSIIAGLSLVNKQAEAIMIVLADQPLIDSQTITRLIEEFQKHDKGIVIPAYQGRRGHPVIFSIKYKERLLELRGDVGGKQIINEHLEDVLEVPIESEGINIDIDTMSDYEHLTKL